MLRWTAVPKGGWKIRQATMEKVPYMLTIGDKECEERPSQSASATARIWAA